MKILSGAQIKEADNSTINSRKITSLELMEYASTQCFNFIKENLNIQQRTIKIFCGVGNNGGDGLVIARLLASKKVKISCYIVHFSEKKSDDFTENYKRIKTIKNVHCYDIVNSEHFPVIQPNDIVIDAIFGVGLTRTPEGFIKKLIQHINASKSTIISIDMPSGLFTESPVLDKDSVIKATLILTFQVPKLALLLPENAAYCNDFKIMDIGLDQAFIDTLSVQNFFITKSFVNTLFKIRTKFQHKGSFGHALILGGSYGKIGAVVLSSKAALKVGSGLVSAYVPKCGYQIIQTSVPEIMVEVDAENELHYFNFKSDGTSVGLGPGIGTSEKTAEGFINFLKEYTKPLVLDADALNILASRKDDLKYIPTNSVLTPHPKEFERLVGSWKNDFDKLQKLKEFSSMYSCVVVLKGAHTVIVFKNNCYFNSTGNAALATAGSGDVLTGIITGLIAQGYTPLNAAIIGVFIHGKTAEIYTKKNPLETFIASDIIELLPKALKKTFYK